MGRGLAEDMLLAAWLVLRRHGDKVLAAARPSAYLMSSAQKQVLDEVRAQQLLTNVASIRGRAREVLPSVVRPVGSTATDLATALRHERWDANTGDARRTVRQVRRHDQPPLVHGSGPHTPQLGEREPWFCAFIDLLVTHGADQTVTVAAVDRLSDLIAATYVGQIDDDGRGGADPSAGAGLRGLADRVEASRGRVVAAGDAARRRLERDLHDGAQQRLLAASYELRAGQRRRSRGIGCRVLAG